MSLFQREGVKGMDTVRKCTSRCAAKRDGYKWDVGRAIVWRSDYDPIL
jgi:hypothetical protein